MQTVGLANLSPLARFVLRKMGLFESSELRHVQIYTSISYRILKFVVYYEADKVVNIMTKE